jgi:hypothetical protein
MGRVLVAFGFIVCVQAMSLACGNWQLATGNWQLATGNWQLETGNWQLETHTM